MKEWVKDQCGAVHGYHHTGYTSQKRRRMLRALARLVLRKGLSFSDVNTSRGSDAYMLCQKLGICNAEDFRSFNDQLPHFIHKKEGAI